MPQEAVWPPRTLWRSKKCFSSAGNWTTAIQPLDQSSYQLRFSGSFNIRRMDILNCIFPRYLLVLQRLCGRPGSRLPAHYIIVTLLNPRLMYKSCTKYVCSDAGHEDWSVLPLQLLSHSATSTVATQSALTPRHFAVPVPGEVSIILASAVELLGAAQCN